METKLTQDVDTNPAKITFKGVISLLVKSMSEEQYFENYKHNPSPFEKNIWLWKESRGCLIEAAHETRSIW